MTLIYLGAIGDFPLPAFPEFLGFQFLGITDATTASVPDPTQAFTKHPGDTEQSTWVIWSVSEGINFFNSDPAPPPADEVFDALVTENSPKGFPPQQTGSEVALGIRRFQSGPPPGEVDIDDGPWGTSYSTNRGAQVVGVAKWDGPVYIHQIIRQTLPGAGGLTVSKLESQAVVILFGGDDLQDPKTEAETWGGATSLGTAEAAAFFTTADGAPIGAPAFGAYWPPAPGGTSVLIPRPPLGYAETIGWSVVLLLGATPLQTDILQPLPAAWGTVSANGSADDLAHRYWRILGTQSGGGLGAGSLAELEFHAVVGNDPPDLTNPGQATAQTIVGSESQFNPGRNVFNDTVGGQVYQGGSSSAVANGDYWVGWDFGSGGDVAVKGCSLFAREDQFGRQTIRGFDLQYSDDGAAWTTLFSVTGGDEWAGGERRVFFVV